MWFVEKSRIVGEHNSLPTPPTIRDHQTERNQTGETAKGKCVQVRTRLLFVEIFLCLVIASKSLYLLAGFVLIEIP